MLLLASQWALASVTPFCYATQIIFKSELNHSVEAACIQIESTIEGKVHRPGSTEYSKQQASYWLGEQAHDYLPACRVTPLSTQDVSTTVRLLGQLGVPFAIKSGGHSFLPGASNIHGKISIDLSQMNTVTLADDGRSVRVQPGATWAEVYETLEPHGLTAVGGRAGSVGVGGLVLGGGSSWHASRHGWACDSVLEFEAVLFGTILRASRTENGELFWALKGGGNNFGIVTALRLNTIPQRDLFLSSRRYVQSQLSDVVLALERVTDGAPDDLDTSFIMSFLPDEAHGTQGGLALVNVDNDDDAPAFKHFSDVADSGRESVSIKQSELAEKLSQMQDRGSRKVKFSIAVHNKAVVLNQILSAFQNFSKTLEGRAVTGPYLTFQPLTTSHIANRDNALGLSDVKMPLMLVALEMYWTAAGQDDFFHHSARSAHDALSKQAENLGMLHPFVYLNYAASWQKPFDGHGEVKCRLQRVKRRIQRMYDPNDRFGGLIPGGHGLPPAHEQCKDTDGNSMGGRGT